MKHVKRTVVYRVKYVKGTVVRVSPTNIEHQGFPDSMIKQQLAANLLIST